MSTPIENGTNVKLQDGEVGVLLASFKSSRNFGWVYVFESVSGNLEFVAEDYFEVIEPPPSVSPEHRDYFFCSI